MSEPATEQPNKQTSKGSNDEEPSSPVARAITLALLALSCLNEDLTEMVHVDIHIKHTRRVEAPTGSQTP